MTVVLVVANKIIRMYEELKDPENEYTFDEFGEYILYLMIAYSYNKGPYAKTSISKEDKKELQEYFGSYYDDMLYEIPDMAEEISRQDFIRDRMRLALVIGMMPGMSLTAYAGDGDPYASLLNTTTVVKFDNKDWYLIENDSTAVDAGTVTLLSKECVGASQYNNSSGYVEYNSSIVKTVVDNWFNNNFSDGAKSAVYEGKMFLLTLEQANTIKAGRVRCLPTFFLIRDTVCMHFLFGEIEII